MTLVGWDDSAKGAEARDRWHRRRAAVLFWRMLRRYARDDPSATLSASNLRAAVRLLSPDQRYAVAAAARVVLGEIDCIKRSAKRVGKERKDG